MATVNVTLGLGNSDIFGTSTGSATAPYSLCTQWNAGTIAGASAGDDIVVWVHPKWWNGAGTTLSFTGTTYNSLTIKQKIDRYTYNTTSFWNMRRLTQWYNYIINWNCDKALTIDGISLDISPLTGNWSSTGAAIIIRNVMFQTFTDGSRTTILSLGASLASGTIVADNCLFLCNATVSIVLGLIGAQAKLTLNQCALLCNTGITFQNVVRYATCNNTISAANATAGDSFHDCTLTHCLALNMAGGNGNTGNWKIITYTTELNAAWPDPRPKASSQMATGHVASGGSGTPTSWDTVVVNSLTTDIKGTSFTSQPAIGCVSASSVTDLTMAALITTMAVGDHIPVQLDLQEAAWVPDATFVGFPSSTPKAQGTAQFDFSGGLAIGWDTGDSFYSMTISGGHFSFAGSNRYGIGENRHWTCLNTGVTQPTFSGGTPTYDAATPYPMHGYRDFCTPQWTVSGVPRDVFLYYGYAPFPGAGGTVNGGYTTDGQMPVWSLDGNTWFSNAAGQEGHEAIPNAVGGPTWQTVEPSAICVDPTNRAIAYRVDMLSSSTSQLIKITGTSAVDSRYAKIGLTITNPTFYGVLADGPIGVVIKDWAGDGLDYVFMASSTSGHNCGLIKCSDASLEDLITGARPLAASAAKTAMLAAMTGGASQSFEVSTNLTGTAIYIGVGEENTTKSLGRWKIDTATKVVTDVTPDLSYAGGKTYPPHTCRTSDYFHRERRLFPNGEEAIFSFSNGIGADSGGTNVTGCLWMEKVAAASAPGGFEPQWAINANQ